MGRGRPPKPGTAEEKAAARRERVRNNVRALRERRKQEATQANPIIGQDQFKLERRDYEDEDDTFDDDGTDQTITLISGSRKSSTSSTATATYMIDRRGDRKVGMLSSMNSRSPYAMAFIGTMRANFLPDSVYLPPAVGNAESRPWESRQFLWTPCAFWITSAFAKASAQDTSVLKTTILAIGMVLKSFEFQDPSLRIAALELYRRSLHGIRKALEPLISNQATRPKDSVTLYLSCHAAAMFELIINSDLTATMHHLRGVSHLISHLGEGEDEEGQSMAWLLLQDYRLAELGLCLKYRYTSFSSLKRRQFENSLGERSAAGCNSNNLFIKVTDIGDEITAVMVQLDIIRPKLQRPGAEAKLRSYLNTLTGIWSKYETLYALVVQNCGPSFVYQDKDSSGLADGSVRFATYDIGAAWCYNLMTQVYCLETSIDAMNMLLEVEMYQSPDASPAESKDSGRSEESCEESNADQFDSMEKLKELRRTHRSTSIKLTQCIQYFLQTDKGVTGQALAIYPLDAAIGLLRCEFLRLQQDIAQFTGHHASPEFEELQKDVANIAAARRFCQELQERAKSFGLPAFQGAGNEYVASLNRDRLNFGEPSHP